MSSEVLFLDLEDLLGLVRALGTGPVRDVGLLDAACARPRATAFGVDAYPSIHAKAAALLHSLVRSHALVDGNKRLGWLATVVMMELNDLRVEASDDDAFELVVRVAEGGTDVEAIARRLEGWTCARRPDQAARWTHVRERASDAGIQVQHHDVVEGLRRDRG